MPGHPGGVSQAHLNAHGFRLRHADVWVLALEVVEHSDGEVVRQQLTALAERVDVPQQIVSDHGADLAKGIRLFQQAQPTVIDTYDVTHKMACLLKGLLEHDERWQAFVRQGAATGVRLRQTAASFLLPPTLRSKARYLNLEALLNWAKRMQGLATPAGSTRLAAALEMPETAAATWWQETFGWREAFRSDLETWSQYWELVSQAEAQVRAVGLRVDAGQPYRASRSRPRGSDARVSRLAEQIEGFLTTEGQKAATGAALLGSSEVIESVFGSDKQYVERSVWSEIGSNVLLLPVLLVSVTTELLGRALQAVSGRAVWAWCREHLGKSRQQLFRQVFGKTQAKKADPSAARVTGATSPEAVVASQPPTAEAGSAGQPPPAETGAAGRPPPAGKVAA